MFKYYLFHLPITIYEKGKPQVKKVFHRMAVDKGSLSWLLGKWMKENFPEGTKVAMHFDMLQVEK